MIPQNFKFDFERNSSVRVPFRWQTVNPDGTRTAINLTGKRVSISFRVRGAAADMLQLDSSVAANKFGAKLEITSHIGGQFQIVVPTAQIGDFPSGYGEYVLRFHDGGESRILAEGIFSVKE